MRQKIASSAVKRVTPPAAHLGGGCSISVRGIFPGRVDTCFFSLALKIDAARADGKPSVILQAVTLEQCAS